MIAVFKINFSVLSKCASKLNSFSSEDIGNKLSLQTGSPLGHVRERRRTKAIGGGGGAVRNLVKRSLVRHACLRSNVSLLASYNKLIWVKMLQKQLKSRAIAVNEDLPRKMLFSISVCR